MSSDSVHFAGEWARGLRSGDLIIVCPNSRSKVPTEEKTPEHHHRSRVLCVPPFSLLLLLLTIFIIRSASDYAQPQEATTRKKTTWIQDEKISWIWIKSLKPSNLISVPAFLVATARIHIYRGFVLIFSVILSAPKDNASTQCYFIRFGSCLVCGLYLVTRDSLQTHFTIRWHRCLGSIIIIYARNASNQSLLVSAVRLFLHTSPPLTLTPSNAAEAKQDTTK